MTYRELSTELFFLEMKDAWGDEPTFNNWPVYPGGEVELIRAEFCEVNQVHIWPDLQRKCIYIYWPEFRNILSGLHDQLV